MKILGLLMLLLFADPSTSTVRAMPGSLVGQWKIGEPFVNMAPRPTALTTEQVKKLVGQRLSIEPTVISACGTKIQITSVKAKTYSAEAFLQSFGITPDQIGLAAPLATYSPLSQGLTAICGGTEGIEIVHDGQNAVLEDANMYFHLSK